MPQGRGEAHRTFRLPVVEGGSSEQVEVGFLYLVALAGANASGHGAMFAGVITAEDGSAGA